MSNALTNTSLQKEYGVQTKYGGNIMKKILSLVLALLMVFSLSVTAFASSEESSDDVAPVSSENLSTDPTVGGTKGNFSGYAHRVCGTGEGTFNVYVTGSTGFSAGLTFKTECNYSTAIAIISIQRPNTGYLLDEFTFTANQEEEFEFYFPTSGTYKVSYTVYDPSGTMHMQCWIYG